jgi:hypothetical protein
LDARFYFQTGLERCKCKFYCAAQHKITNLDP